VCTLIASNLTIFVLSFYLEMPSRRKSTPCKILTAQAAAATAETPSSETSTTPNKAVDSPASTPSVPMDQDVLKVQPESPGECSRRVQEEVPVSQQTTMLKDPVPFSPRNFTDENLILHYMRENAKLVTSIVGEKDLSADHKELCLQQIIHCVKNARDKLRNAQKDQVRSLFVIGLSRARTKRACLINATRFFLISRFLHLFFKLGSISSVFREKKTWTVEREMSKVTVDSTTFLFFQRFFFLKTTFSETLSLVDREKIEN
jgi:hypothetical protein